MRARTRRRHARNVDTNGQMQGTFPYTCSACGVTFESVSELADPTNHDG